MIHGFYASDTNTLQCYAIGNSRINAIYDVMYIIEVQKNVIGVVSSTAVVTTATNTVSATWNRYQV